MGENFQRVPLVCHKMPFPKRHRHQQTIRKRQVQICTIGEKPEPAVQKVSGKRERYKRTKARNLLERLIREQESLFTFALMNKYLLPTTWQNVILDLQKLK